MIWSKRFLGIVRSRGRVTLGALNIAWSAERAAGEPSIVSAIGAARNAGWLIATAGPEYYLSPKGLIYLEN